jgi:signal transduction histidine kinase
MSDLSVALSLEERLDRLLDLAMKNETASFRSLVEIAGLDPACDFISVSLREMDFRDEDLSGFNFSNADLTGADFRRTKVDGVSFQGADLTGAIGLPQDAYWEPVDMCDVLKSVVRVVSGNSVDVVFGTNFKSKMLPVLGNRNQLFQAFIELVTNAAQAVQHLRFGGKGKVTIRGGPTKKYIPDLRALEFRVEDNGPGIDPSFLPKIFDVGFTTKPTGTGLGLNFVRKIIHAHNGLVLVHSLPGHTAFRIVLPEAGEGIESGRHLFKLNNSIDGGHASPWQTKTPPALPATAKTRGGRR